MIEPEPLLRNVEPNVALHSHIKRLGDELYGLCGGQLRINSQCFVDERVGRWKLNPHNQSHFGCVWCGTTQKTERDRKDGGRNTKVKFGEEERNRGRLPRTSFFLFSLFFGVTGENK